MQLGLAASQPLMASVRESRAAKTDSAASALQASGFRSDVTWFRLNAAAGCRFGSQPVFLRNPEERGYTSGEAHNPEVAGSNPAPLSKKPACGLSSQAVDRRVLLPVLLPEPNIRASVFSAAPGKSRVATVSILGWEAPDSPAVRWPLRFCHPVPGGHGSGHWLGCRRGVRRLRPFRASPRKPPDFDRARRCRPRRLGMDDSRSVRGGQVLVMARPCGNTATGREHGSTSSLERSPRPRALPVWFGRRGRAARVALDW